MKNCSYYIFFRNFSNPLRIRIITALMNRESSVSELSEKLKVEQSKLSHALSSLKHCSIVEVKQKGKSRIYYLNKKTVVPILKLIDKHKCTCCDKK